MCCLFRLFYTWPRRSFTCFTRFMYIYSRSTAAYGNFREGYIFQTGVISSLPGRDRGINFRKCRTQFVGGETAHECLPLIRKLRAENKGALLAYSVEADEEARPTDEPHQHIVEMIRAIEFAARCESSLARETSSSGRRTWVAVKLVRTPLLSYREMKLRQIGVN